MVLTITWRGLDFRRMVRIHANASPSARAGTLVGRALLERRVVHIPDVLADREYKSVKAQQLGQFRAILGVPMLRGETTLGVFFIARRTPRPSQISRSNW